MSPADKVTLIGLVTFIMAFPVVLILTMIVYAWNEKRTAHLWETVKDDFVRRYQVNKNTGERRVRASKLGLPPLNEAWLRGHTDVL